MSISTPFIRRPIATSLLFVGIFLAGLAAFPMLPVAPLPNVEFPTLDVTAQYPGASPETMASTVATPLETEFGQMLPGLTQMTSTSVTGTSQITLQFSLNTNINNAATLVLEAINAADGSLPKGMPSPPTFREVNPSDAPILILSMRSDQAPITEVDNYAENLFEQQLSQLPGVGEVLVGGQQTPAIRVQIDPAKLASMGLTLEDVRNVLTNATVDDPKGSIDGKQQSYTIYANDQLTAANAYNTVIIGYRNGGPIRIGDVGRAVSGPENDELAAWTNGKPSILLLVFKQPNANVITTADGVKAKLPSLEANIPRNIKVSVVSDRTLTIRASVNDVEFTLMLAIALVVMVIFLFLRNFWATIIPSVTIPVALVGTLGAMYLCGFSLDNLSLMGLTIAVGFVVDDAIVMLENIFRHIEHGMKPIDAAIKGAGEIGFTIVSISFSLIAVFIPLLLMGGIVGRLFWEFAACVSMTIIISAMVSLTLTPMMASRFLTPEAHAHGAFYNFVERIFDRHPALLRAHARRGTEVPLRRPDGLRGDRIAHGLSLRHYPERVLSRGGHRDPDRHHRRRAGHFLPGNVYPAAGGERDRPRQSGGRLRGLFRRRRLGRPDREQRAGVHNPEAMGRALFQRQAGDRADRPEDGGGQGNSTVPAGDPGRARGRPAQSYQYQYTLEDASSSELNFWAPKILDKIRTLPQLADVTSDQQIAGTTETLTYDRDQAARFGVQPATIDNILYDAFGQREVAQYFTGDKAYYVILEVLPNEEGKLSTLQDLYVTSSSGQAVPLSTLVHETTVPVQPLAVNHVNQMPAVTISFNLKGNASLGDAVTDIQRLEVRDGRAGDLAGLVSGDGTGVPGVARQRALSHRGGDRHRLHHPRHAL